jgi:NAD(P)-dependent dehydrogenase (short-subunit alcohol dehydrogenase family)
MSPRIFFITGTSTGFGLEYVKVLLSKGDHVIATARKSSNLKFEGANDENCLLVDLDVTSQSSIDKAFEAGLKKFGRIDVVCNNAGYGLSGEFESLSDKQIRTQMEVNFFGLIDVTRKAMQVMREQEPKGGVIQQVTSIGGQVGVPTFSICKFLNMPKVGRMQPVADYIRLCLKMGSGRIYRSSPTRSKARVEHQIYLHVRLPRHNFLCI